jgi:hypothetical protein
VDRKENINPLLLFPTVTVQTCFITKPLLSIRLFRDRSLAKGLYATITHKTYHKLELIWTVKNSVPTAKKRFSSIIKDNTVYSEAHIVPMAFTSSIEILERFHSKASRMTVDAPWYVPNTAIRRDLQTPTVKKEIRRYSSQYSARLSAHPNDLIVNLIELPDNRRLRRHLPNDLSTRFLV